jgi:hypothetical protein
MHRRLYHQLVEKLRIDNLNDRYSFLFNLTDSLHFPVKD